MNCFIWQNKSSDYLDGLLMPAEKKEADKHLDSCPACMERFKRYRTILTSISTQPRTQLPISIRKAPLAFALPRLDLHTHRSRWERTPWYIRTTIEAIGVAALILFVVTLVPKMRSMYEKSVEKRLEVFNAEELMTEMDLGTKKGEVPLARGKTDTTTTEHEGDDYSGDEEGDEDTIQSAETTEEGDVKVGNSEIWRFVLKTDSPHELRSKIVDLLLSSGLQKSTDGIGGIEAPGGIQFDLLVPKSVVGHVKHGLQKLSSTINKQQAGASPLGDSFTWYKNKSKKFIPAGKARIVIWLSQT
jgi:hypothetical protein